MAPCNGTTSTPPKLAVTLPPNHSTLQRHPAMAPSNGTTSTPPKLVVNPPAHTTMAMPAMAPLPLHPAMAPWCHVQSAKVVRKHVRTDATKGQPEGTSSWQTQCKKNPTRYVKSAWMSERTSEDMSDRMWDGMLSKQERISEGTSKDCWKDVPERMSEWMPESQEECQKVCQTEGQKERWRFARKIVRENDPRHVSNNARKIGSKAPHVHRATSTRRF